MYGYQFFNQLIYLTFNQYQKKQMDYQTPYPTSQNKKCQVTSESFSIQISLSQQYLTVGLRDFESCKKYKKQYKKENESGQHFSKMSYEDIFQSIRQPIVNQCVRQASKNTQFEPNSQVGYVDAGFGSKVIHDSLDWFKVQKDGKINVYMNLLDKRTKKNRVFQQQLLLGDPTQMSQIEVAVEKCKISPIKTNYIILKQKSEHEKQKKQLLRRLQAMQNNFEALKKRQSLLQFYAFKDNSDLNRDKYFIKLGELERKEKEQIFNQKSLTAQWDLYVYPSSSGNVAKIFGKQFKCSIGRNGATAFKKQGDGKTPVGTFPLREIWIRTDKVSKENFDLAVNTGLPVRIINPYDGWCDEPKSQFYNKHVDLRTFDNKISHQNLWRQDNLYDCFMVVGFNDNPIIPGVGSAIFIHIARQNYSGTAGCVAFSTPDLWTVISNIKAYSRITVYDQRNQINAGDSL